MHAGEQCTSASVGASFDLFGGVVVGGLVPVRVSLFLDGGQVTFWAPFPLGGPGPVITELMRLVSWTS